MKLDKAKLQQYIDKKLIKVQKHPDAELYIYNYTPECQFTRSWDEITMMCRGLITDGDGNIVARPFKKFFNLEECETIPKGDFKVCEKLDGSLGILYWLNDRPQIATRGSFISEQAKYATQLLHERYSAIINVLNPKYTYLFEIIYPQNKIVVNYGTREELVLLAVIETQSGEEYDIYNNFPELTFEKAQLYDDLNDISTLSSLNKENAEGFVIRFSDGTRIKVKFDEYKRLHRIITGINERDIWELLKDNKSGLDELLQKVPDEFYDWVKETVDNLNLAYDKIEQDAHRDYEMIRHIEDRKVFAIEALKSPYASLLFLMRDQKPYVDSIWRLIYPKEIHTFKDAEL